MVSKIKKHKPISIHVENNGAVYDAILDNNETACVIWCNGTLIVMKKETEIFYKDGKLFFTGGNATITVQKIGEK